MNIQYTGNCSIKELAGLRWMIGPEPTSRTEAPVPTTAGPKGLLAAINIAKLSHGAWLFWFSDVLADYAATKINYCYGEALAAYIVKYGLGDVVVTPTAAKSTSNGHMVKMWCWAPDWTKLRNWSKAQEEAVDAKMASTAQKLTIPEMKPVRKKRILKKKVIHV